MTDRMREDDAEDQAGSTLIAEHTEQITPDNIRQDIHGVNSTEAIKLITTEAAESLPLPTSAEEWGAILKMALRAGTSSILSIGRLFHAAKSNLVHGEWSRIWRLKRSERPPGTKRTGDKYALIGQEFGSSNEKWSSHFNNHLPASVEALHALARLGRELVIQLILDGTIHEGLTATKALQLLFRYRPDLKKPRPFNPDHWLASFERHLDVLETKASPHQVRTALRAAQEALDRMQSRTVAQPFHLEIKTAA